MKVRYCFVLMFAAGLACAAEQAVVSDAPVLWKGIEVVTNDFDSIERIRKATPLPANSVLPLSDVKLRVACDAVRNKFPSSKIECSSDVEPSSNGALEGWYLVEVNVAARTPLRCLEGAGLDPRLIVLSQQWLRAIATFSESGKTPTEQLNDRDTLDYEDAELSAMAARLYGVARSRAVEVEAGAVSCRALDRMHSLHLMNFTGDPQRFVTMAAVHVNDDDDGAARAAARFLARFAEFIDLRNAPLVAAEACKGVLSGNFAARRSSLELLIDLQRSGALRFEQLGSSCQRQIRDIARTSFALPAKKLLDMAPQAGSAS